MKELEETRQYAFFPSEAIKYLPKEWQDNIQSVMNEAQCALEMVDEDLATLNRIIHSFPTMVSLHYIQRRLASIKFEATEEWLLETEMLTLAFVTTYSRLVNGGIGSGVSRNKLPVELRPIHDHIIEIRNKRYAHSDEHPSVVGNLGVAFENSEFTIRSNFTVEIQVNGALEWEPLVVFLDQLMFDRLHAQLRKMKEKTGHEWTFPSGPPPKWISSET